MNEPSHDHRVAAGHVPVMRDEVIQALQVRDGGVYLDGTFGGGGHARAILEEGGANTRLIAVDADPDAIERAMNLRATLAGPDRMVVLHTNLRDMEAALDAANIDRVDGAFFDLGVSSFQLDTPERGFSFRFDAPLDMRFDPTSGQSAADLLNSLPEAELADVLYQFGEERKSRRIAAAIVQARSHETEWTTRKLADMIERTIGRKPGAAIHPATRSFQALRIAVNGELDALSLALDTVTDRLNIGGRLVVISFHSLEDRIVKRFIADAAKGCICPPSQPVCTCNVTPRLTRVGKAVRPSEDELARNVRSRSSIMRIAQRC